MLKKFLRALDFKTFEKNKEKVNEENQSGIEKILIFDTIILALNLAGEVVNTGNITHIFHMHTLMAQVIYVIGAMLLYFLILRKRKVNYTLWIYIIEMPMLLITMAAGMINRPDELTFTFLFFLLLLPILILDKPWRVILYIFIMSGIYAVADSMAKEPAIFERDMLHLANVCLMSVSASLYVLSVRIQNIDYAGYFARKADRDPLTGIFNRSGSSRHIDPSKPAIFLFIDLDHFKEVNDKFGHAEGDQVLVRAAGVLKKDFRKDDVIARMGGDEFAVWAPGRWERGDIQRKLTALLKDLRDTGKAEESGSAVPMSASIGCVYAPDGCKTLDLMTRLADQEMYRVKENGKDNYRIAVI